MEELSEDVLNEVLMTALVRPNRIACYDGHPFYVLLVTGRARIIWFANPRVDQKTYNEVQALIRQWYNAEVMSEQQFQSEAQE